MGIKSGERVFCLGAKRFPFFFVVGIKVVMDFKILLVQEKCCCKKND